MASILFRDCRRQFWKTLLLLFVFVAAGLLHFVAIEQVDADDLSSSYIGCRLLASGQANHLYAYDPKNFAAVGLDDPWQNAADEGGYVAFLHPYVQTPLWAWSLQPLCKRTHFRAFEWIFAVMAMAAFAACLALVAFYWAPLLANPCAMGVAVLLLWFSEPFQYSMELMQTHVFFVLLMIAGLLLAEKEHPLLAGFMIALAAAVKLTPGVLVLYWLVRRNWKAAGSAAAWSVAIWMVTARLAGPHLMATYLEDLRRISHTLLLSRNNQSLAAWIMARFYPASEISAFHMLPLPAAVRLASTALLGAGAIAGGLLDRSLAKPVSCASTPSQRHPSAPLGGLFAIVGATVFAPIAWTHYYIVLLPALMVLVQENRYLRSGWATALTAAVLFLNLPPLAADLSAQTIDGFALLRSHFYGGILCLADLTWVALQKRRLDRRQQDSPENNTEAARRHPRTMLKASA